MRHQLKGKKLNRTASHRSATLRSLSIALIKNERIVTTTVKAKELRRIIEPIITRAKEDTTHNRREVFAFLHDNKSTSKLFDEIAPKCASRPGGYTRVIKLGTRQGDGAEIAVIELVDYNDVRPDNAGSKKKRTRRGGAKPKTSSAPAAAPAAAAASAPVVSSVVEDTAGDGDAAEVAAAPVQEIEATVSTETVDQASEAVTDEAPAASEETPEAEDGSDTPSDSDEKKDA